MRFSNALLIGVALISSACGTTPYREEFACSLTDDYGKCIDVPGAYLEAVTGIDSGAPALSRQGASVQPLQTTPDHRQPASGTALNAERSRPSGRDYYGAYRQALYEQLRAMLAAPTTPMIRAPQTLRTLILSYEKRGDPSRLYMPRYVFSIHQGPSFVLGQYLDRSADSLPGSMVNVSQDDLSKDSH